MEEKKQQTAPVLEPLGSALEVERAIEALLYAAAAGTVMFRARKEAPPLMFVPMLLYLLCNGTMNLFSLARLCAAPSGLSLIACCGALLFFVSDCTLFLMRYDPKRGEFFKPGFLVMLTYELGVLLIAMGN